MFFDPIFKPKMSLLKSLQGVLRASRVKKFSKNLSIYLSIYLSIEGERLRLSLATMLRLSFMSAANITQKFILPASPWWGGFYERLVRSFKSSLRKILGLSYLTYEEIETTLIEIESTINTSPLTYIIEDDLDNIITSNHLIFGADIHNNHINNNNTPTSLYVPSNV